MAVFLTCMNNTRFPDVGIATVRVLERLGHEVARARRMLPTVTFSSSPSAALDIEQSHVVNVHGRERSIFWSSPGDCLAFGFAGFARAIDKFETSFVGSLRLCRRRHAPSECNMSLRSARSLRTVTSETANSFASSVT